MTMVDLSRLLLSLFVAIQQGERLQAWPLSATPPRRYRERHHSPVRLRSSFEEDHNFEGGEEDQLPEERSSDWVTAEFTLLNAPEEPTPDLDAVTVAITVARSLQWVDYPTKNAGLERCFDFFAWECRKAVTARRGGDTLERFVEHGVLSPALQPFMGAHRVDIGEGTFTPAHAPLRGALVSLPIIIHGAPIYAVQHMSGMNRTGVSAPSETHMVMRLEEQRRPPLQGCWLVREILDVRHFFAGDMGNVHVGG